MRQLGKGKTLHRHPLQRARAQPHIRH